MKTKAIYFSTMALAITVSAVANAIEWHRQDMPAEKSQRIERFLAEMRASGFQEVNLGYGDGAGEGPFWFSGYRTFQRKADEAPRLLHINVGIDPEKTSGRLSLYNDYRGVGTAKAKALDLPIESWDQPIDGVNSLESLTALSKKLNDVPSACREGSLAGALGDALCAGL